MKLATFQPLVLRVARSLLLLSLRPAIRKRLAGIFRLVDQEVPPALAEGAAPIVIEGLVVHAVKKATGIQPTAAEAQIIGALFDVIAAAIPVERRL